MLFTSRMKSTEVKNPRQTKTHAREDALHLTLARVGNLLAGLRRRGFSLELAESLYRYIVF